MAFTVQDTKSNDMGRRQNRYLRRKEQREKKKEKIKNINFEDVAGLDSLYKAAYASAKGVRWKASVQKYTLNLLFNINKTRKDLLKNKDIRKGFIEFDINERGKVRHIKSVHFSERVVQKSLCTNALYPVLTNGLINDNGASQKGKGTHFATNRLIKSLHKHYKRYGNNGYVLLLDFKSYFDNIDHKKLKEIYRKYFNDEKIINLANDFIDAFGDMGLGLGSETSQISAVAYANTIDHYIKEKAKIKCYGRYMDDSHIVSNSKEFLENLLEELKVQFNEYGIKLNTKKTRIVKLKNGFTFLKTRFFLNDSGKVIRKPCRKSITVERRKLKRQAKLCNKGIITEDTVHDSFMSWLGSMKHRTARKSAYSMKCLYKTLFNKEEKDNGKNEQRSIN